MPRLPILSAREILRLLKGDGFHVVSQKGSHLRLHGTVAGRTRVVVVPNHPEVERGTLASILRPAGWTREDLIRRLGR